MDDTAETWDLADPSADGLPEIADEDSFADDEQRHVSADGYPLPPDREEGPIALEEYGITAGERLRGEPLERRLMRELPDVGGYEPINPNPRLADDLDPDAVAQLAPDTDYFGVDIVDPRLDSVVSLYDRHVPGVDSVVRVGRLMRPNGGGYASNEADEVATDAGRTGGGFSNEELAMHEIAPEQMELEERMSTPDPYVKEPVIRTGAEQPWDPEDLAVAEGRDPTPRNVERARRELEELGPAAIEKTVP